MWLSPADRAEIPEFQKRAAGLGFVVLKVEGRWKGFVGAGAFLCAAP